MEFEPMKILLLGAALSFLLTALGMLKREDWGKLDFCEYSFLLVKQIHVLTICILIYTFISAALFIVFNNISYTSLLLNPTNPKLRYFLLLLEGYIPSQMLSWLTLIKRLRPPLSGVDCAILRWREIFIEQLRTEFKLRLVKLHCDLTPADKAAKIKLYSFYDEHKTCIAQDLKSKKTLRVHPQDYPLMTRYLIEWQGYYATARLLGRSGFWFEKRPVLCPLGTMAILATIIYLLYHFGFFNLAAS